MRDVATAAGVSLKTVSRVINGEAAVAPATAARVAEAIAELGFERNDLARSLRNGHSSGTLGLVIEDVGNPFYSVVTQAVEDAARLRGLLLITASAREDPDREHELVTALRRRRVDAMLVVPIADDHRYLLRNGDHVSTVFLDRPPQKIEADTVLADNRAGARRATEHLLAHGHERIALMGDDAGLYTARERVAGYREALSARRVTDQGLVRMGNHTAAAAEAAVASVLELEADERPTAILAANNRNTVGAVRALARLGGDDRIALVGFDDFELADVLGITVMRSDPALMGLRAAELAFARLDGDDRPPNQVTIPTELVVRGSGELRPRSGD
jgi:LacI family transcriptional regulator, galactose operon repressor